MEKVYTVFICDVCGANMSKHSDPFCMPGYEKGDLNIQLNLGKHLPSQTALICSKCKSEICDLIYRLQHPKEQRV